MFESPYRSKKEGQQKQSFLLVRVGRFGKLRSRSRRAGIEQQSTGLLHFKCSNLPIGAKKKDSNKLSFFFGPSGEIRTPGILNPNRGIIFFLILFSPFRGFCSERSCFPELFAPLFPSVRILSMVKNVVNALACRKARAFWCRKPNGWYGWVCVIVPWMSR